MSDCIFCKIIKGEVPSYKIWEDDSFLVFLDAFPNNFGQTLVIPKAHESYVFNLDDESYIRLMKTTKKIAEVLKKAFGVGRICVKIEGFEVPHTHVKLYPTNVAADLHKETYKAEPEELDRALALIKQNL